MARKGNLEDGDFFAYGQKGRNGPLTAPGVVTNSRGAANVALARGQRVTSPSTKFTRLAQLRSNAAIRSNRQQAGNAFRVATAGVAGMGGVRNVRSASDEQVSRLESMRRRQGQTKEAQERDVVAGQQRTDRTARLKAAGDERTLQFNREMALARAPNEARAEGIAAEGKAQRDFDSAESKAKRDAETTARNENIQNGLDVAKISAGAKTAVAETNRIASENVAQINAKGKASPLDKFDVSRYNGVSGEIEGILGVLENEFLEEPERVRLEGQLEELRKRQETINTEFKARQDADATATAAEDPGVFSEQTGVVMEETNPGAGSVGTQTEVAFADDLPGTGVDPRDEQVYDFLKVKDPKEMLLHEKMAWDTLQKIYFSKGK